ncbi:MAG: hypothetical protein ACJAZO_005073 [Myxococcota bacterium]|jgi:hypothetical protein
MRTVTLLCALSMPLIATAVPLELTHSGRLLDVQGSPYEGSQNLEVGLFAAASGGTPIWTSGITSVQFQKGYYTTVLGTDGGLDETVLDGSDAWIQLSFDSQPLLPRTQIRSVPYAIRAHALTDGPVDASSLAVSRWSTEAGTSRSTFLTLT